MFIVYSGSEFSLTSLLHPPFQAIQLEVLLTLQMITLSLSSIMPNTIVIWNFAHNDLDTSFCVWKCLTMVDLSASVSQRNELKFSERRD